MKKIINIQNLKYFSNEKNNWSMYAFMQMLFGFKGITYFDQKKFYEIHRRSMDNDVKNTSNFIDNLNLVVQGIIECRRDPDLTSDDIRKYIVNDNPVCVILHFNQDEDCWQSFIVCGFNNFEGLFYIIDHNNDLKKKCYIMFLISTLMIISSTIDPKKFLLCVNFMKLCL
jgi:hypothetical protein